jgi:transcriptional regulator with XRE-family HTH domain
MESEGLGPAVQRAILIQELRRLRSISEETQEEVAEARGWSVSKFIRIENGVTPVSKSDLEGLLRHYGVKDPQRTDELLELARGARQPAYWAGKYKGEDKAFQAFLGYEDGAATVRMSQTVVIPGVLQIESYIRLIAEAYQLDEDETESLVELRLMRQARMAKKAPEQTYILDESLLHRPVGTVMPDQLRHLLRLAEKPKVNFRVIPTAAGLHFGLQGSFTLLGFGNHLEDVLFIEGPRRGDLLIGAREAVGDGANGIDQPEDEVARYQEGFANLLKIALGPKDSLDAIEQAASELS